MTASCALLDHFGDWVDPRTRACPHALDELPLTAISAILSGADTWVSVAAMGPGQAGLAAAVPALGQRHRGP